MVSLSVKLKTAYCPGAAVAAVAAVVWLSGCEFPGFRMSAFNTSINSLASAIACFHIKTEL